MKSLDEYEKLFKEEKYGEIIQSLEKVPASEKDNDLVLMLAKSYLMSGKGWEDRQLYDKALELLKPLAKEMSRNPVWNFWMGVGYRKLEEWGRAIVYYKRVQKRYPSHKTFQETVTNLKRRLAVPIFKEPFTKRAQNAWNAFTQIEPKVLQAARKASVDQKGAEDTLALCRKAFSQVIKEPGVRIGEILFGNNTAGMVFSPEGHWYKFFEQLALALQIPPKLQKNWRLNVGEPASNGMVLDVGDFRLSNDDFYVWLSRTKDGSKLSVYCQKLADLPDSAKEWREKVTTGYVNNAIGELARMKYFGKPNFLKTPRKSRPIRLTDLHDFLVSKGYRLDMQAVDYFMATVPYHIHRNKRFIQKEGIGNPRDDITEGASTFNELVFEFADGKNKIADELIESGAVPGCFFFTPR